MSIMKSQNLYNYLDFNVTTKKNEKKWDAFGSGHSCSKGRWHYPVQLVLLILIHWIEIYPMNNWGQSTVNSRNSGRMKNKVKRPSRHGM